MKPNTTKGILYSPLFLLFVGAPFVHITSGWRADQFYDTVMGAVVVGLPIAYLSLIFTVKPSIYFLKKIGALSLTSFSLLAMILGVLIPVILELILPIEHYPSFISVESIAFCSFISVGIAVSFWYISGYSDYNAKT